jgi:hypothetical protein
MVIIPTSQQFVKQPAFQGFLSVKEGKFSSGIVPGRSHVSPQKRTPRLRRDKGSSFSLDIIAEVTYDWFQFGSFGFV